MPTNKNHFESLTPEELQENRGSAQEEVNGNDLEIIEGAVQKVKMEKHAEAGYEATKSAIESKFEREMRKLNVAQEDIARLYGGHSQNYRTLVDAWKHGRLDKCIAKDDLPEVSKKISAMEEKSQEIAREKRESLKDLLSIYGNLDREK